MKLITGLSLAYLWLISALSVAYLCLICGLSLPYSISNTGQYRNQ